MAESEVKQPLVTVERDEKKRLKYLDFVQSAAIYLVVCSSSLYDYAKQNSGPLRPGVQTVEGTVKAVMGPVYEKFRDVPLEFLKFVDRKVDESINELDRRMPSLLKRASHELLLAAQKTPEVVREVTSEVRRAGVVDAATNIGKTVYTKYEPVAKDAYLKYEPLAERYAAAAWRSLNRIPLFPQVAQIMVPTAAYWCEKYNDAVTYAAQKDYTVSHYLPKVPIERIGKVFQGKGKGKGKGEENRPTISGNGEALAVSS